MVIMSLVSYQRHLLMLQRPVRCRTSDGAGVQAISKGGALVEQPRLATQQVGPLSRGQRNETMAEGKL